MKIPHVTKKEAENMYLRIDLQGDRNFDSVQDILVVFDMSLVELSLVRLVVANVLQVVGSTRENDLRYQHV